MKRTAFFAAIALAAIALFAASGIAGKDNTKAWLGITAQSVDYDIAEAFNLGIPYGAVVNEVINDSPAKEAGIRKGDVIVGINGDDVTDADELTDFMREAKPGDEVRVTIFRNGREQNITVKAAEAPARDDRSGYYYHYSDDNDDDDSHTFRQHKRDNKHGNIAITQPYKRAYMGVYLQGLNDQLGEYFGVNDGDGALISQVEDDSPAAKAGLRAGDVIIGIEKDRIDGPSDVTDLLEDYRKGDQITVTVVRDRRENTFRVELDENESYSYRYNFGPDMPHINVPKFDNLFHGSWNADRFMEDFDEEEFERAMEKLAETMKKLEFEFEGLEGLKGLKELEKLDLEDNLAELKRNRETRQDIEREVNREMKELRKELRELKRELKREMEELNRKLD